MFLEERRIFISSHCMRFHSRQSQGELWPLPIAQENMSIRMTNRNVSCLVRRNNWCQTNGSTVTRLYLSCPQTFGAMIGETKFNWRNNVKGGIIFPLNTFRFVSSTIIMPCHFKKVFACKNARTIYALEILHKFDE